MIASDIGKIFLEAYNQKFKASYSAKDFFVEKYYELFFNHNKYMMTAGNSPLENPKLSWDKMREGKVPYESVDKRKERFMKIIHKIDSEPADASIAIGYPSLGITATTSGQITNMTLPLNEDDVYLSWIGSGFGVGVQSGLSMLFDHPQILLDLYDGWLIYREFLNKTPQMRGNQINTWNGQWLAHRYNSRSYDELDPTASFNPTDTATGGGIEIKTQAWVNVLSGIAMHYPPARMTAYIYSLGKTNVTVGFIPFELIRIRRPYELYEKYFGSSNSQQVASFFGTAVGFTKACQMGVIGVNALEPKGFKDSFEKGVIPKYGGSEDKINNFNAYQIWLLAMLNNEQLWEKSQQVAEVLNKHSLSDTAAKKVKSQEVNNLLESVNKKQFIDKLTVIVKTTQDVETLSEVAESINKMPVDNVPYFLTLIRFQYAVLNKKS